MLREWGITAYDLGTSRFDQGTSKYDEGTSKFHLGTSAHDLGTSQAKMGVASYTNSSERTGRTVGAKDYLTSRSPDEIMKNLRANFSDEQLRIAFKPKTAGAFEGCAEKPPTNLYRLCNAKDAPHTEFKGKPCFQPARYKHLKDMFAKLAPA